MAPLFTSAMSMSIWLVFKSLFKFIFLLSYLLFRYFYKNKFYQYFEYLYYNFMTKFELFLLHISIKINYLKINIINL